MTVTPELLPALVAEAARKSRVCWLSYDHPGGRVAERLVWHQWYDEALLVLSDPTDQPLEGLAGAEVVTVTMRAKDGGTRLVTWTGEAAVVPPEGASWEPHATALLQVRLNLADPAATLARWRQEATVLRVAPTTLSA